MEETVLQSVPTEYDAMLNNYASIVEKTNQQLSLWTNPYGLMIGFLTILIAVIAIVVSVYLWKNSSDQKKRVDDFFDRQEEDIIKAKKAMESIYKERDEKAKLYEKDLNELIKGYTDKLSGVDAKNAVERAKLEKILEDLNNKKVSLSEYTIPEAIDIDQGIYNVYGLNRSIKTTKCFGCGKDFQYKYQSDVPWNRVRFSTINKIVNCPHCGAENYV